MTTQNPTGSKSDFQAAEDIKNILDGRPEAEQERILRWVGESLELRISIGERPAGPSNPVPLPTHYPAGPSSAPAAATSTDIRSFAQEKRPKSDVQFAVLAAYYYQLLAPEKDRKDAIKSEDLQVAARHAQRAVFTKPKQPLDNAVAQGYLDRAGGGAYKLNAVGENLIAMTLPGVTASAGAGENPVKRKRGPTSGKQRSRVDGD